MEFVFLILGIIPKTLSSFPYSDLFLLALCILLAWLLIQKYVMFGKYRWWIVGVILFIMFKSIIGGT